MSVVVLRTVSTVQSVSTEWLPVFGVTAGTISNCVVHDDTASHGHYPQPFIGRRLVSGVAETDENSIMWWLRMC